MEITHSDRRNDLPATYGSSGEMPCLPAVKQDLTDKRCIAIMERCGNPARFFSCRTPDKLPYLAAHWPDGVRRELSPALVMTMKTYSQLATEEHLKMFVGYTCIRLGLEWDDFEKTQIASTIANTEEARTLPYDCVLGFFNWICEGRYPLYSAKLANVMDAFQCYAKGARTELHKVYEEMERQQREQEWHQHSQECVKFDVSAWIKEHFGNNDS